LAELDYDGLQVGVSGIINKVAELVEVVVDRLFALEIGSCLQNVDGSGFRIQRHEVLSELVFEVQPV